MTAQKCEERDRLTKQLESATVEYVDQVNRKKYAAALGTREDFGRETDKLEKAQKRYRQATQLLFNHREQHRCG